MPIVEKGASQVETIHPQTHSLLSFLLLPSLLRSDVLRDDIQALTGKFEDEIEDQIATVSRQGNLAQFIDHMEESITANPHVILAYAWVLYMALFSGGRILRGILQGASGIGSLFWEREPSLVRPLHPLDLPRQLRSDASSLAEDKRRGRSKSRGPLDEAGDGLGFFSFPGTEDGEDIRIECRKRFAEVELRLAEHEKADIVAEALHIFRFMLGVIDDLDDIVGTSKKDMEAAKMYHKSLKLDAVRDSVDSRTLGEKCHSRFDVLLRWLRIKKTLPPPFEIGATPSVASEKTPSQMDEINMFWLKGAAMVVPTLGCLIVYLAWHMTN